VSITWRGDRASRNGDAQTTETMDKVSESDWKWLRQVRPIALERYCQSILQEIARLSESEVGTSLERYHELWKLIRERDRVIQDAFDGHSRGSAFWKILSLHSNRLLTDEEFHTFPRETCQSIERIVKPPESHGAGS
jgi:hypothetical protein